MPSSTAFDTKTESGVSAALLDHESLCRHFGRPRVIEARTELDLDDGDGKRAYLLLEGWAYTYKLLVDGNRQIVGFAIPGDLIGIGALRRRTDDLMAATVTKAVVRELTAASFDVLFSSSVEAGMALLGALSHDEGVTVEHLVDIGRRTATERVSHFMLELHERLSRVGLAEADGFRCPLSQPLVADALGLTAIHLNRVLRDLRTRNLLVFRTGAVHLPDRRRLADLCGYDPAYLDPPDDTGGVRTKRLTDASRGREAG
jgi:CRP-like cAMP-binding protein